jgi:hypothetical protein
VFIGLLATIRQHEALAETNVDLAQRWGLIGTWMTDCNRTVARDNDKLSFVARNDKLFHDRDLGDWHDSSEVTLITLKSHGSIEILLTYKALNPPLTQLFELIKGQDGRIRAWNNLVINRGNYTIKDGKLTANGMESKWYGRC